MFAGRKISRTKRSEIPELRDFLVRGFKLPATALCFSPDVLAWKYFDGPDGSVDESNSSLIARSRGQLIGHIGICPRQFIWTGDGLNRVSTLHAIDWLGSTEHPGSGTFLMLQALATTETQYALGGSPLAQSVFPMLGFESRPAVTVYRKLLTPLHRLRSSEQGLLHKWAGAGKDILTFCRTRAKQPAAAVELRPVSTFTAEIDELVGQATTRLLTCHRDHHLLNYFLRCPIPGFYGFTIYSSDRLIGYAILKASTQERVRQGKIVDCWLNTDDVDRWQSAVASLIKPFRASAVDAVTCYSTNSMLRSALVENGFLPSGEKNAYVRDKQNLLPSNLPYSFSMLEADHAIF